MSYRWIVLFGLVALAAAGVLDAYLLPDAPPSTATAVALVAACVVVGVLAVARRRQARAVGELRAGLFRLADGDFGHRVYAGRAAALGDLTRAFNAASEDLAERYAALERDRRQLLAVLSGMVEGVVSLDAGQ